MRRRRLKITKKCSGSFPSQTRTWNKLNSWSAKIIFKLTSLDLQTVLGVSCESTVAPWLLHSPPNQAVWVPALAGDIVLCSLTVPLSTWMYKWAPAHLMLGVTLQWTSIPSWGGSLLVASRYGNRDKLRTDEPLGSYREGEGGGAVEEEEDEEEE